jgi:hypothetical protein
MLELIHTSAPRGLDGGRPGYTVVAQTEGLPAELATILVNGSAASVQRLAAHVAPEPFAVYRIWPVGDGLLAISRIVPIAADHTGRPARLAHHVVLAGEEAAGPSIAAMLLDPSWFVDLWTGEPRHLPARPPPAPCRPEDLALAMVAMDHLTTDAGAWASALANRACQLRDVPESILLPPGAPTRQLLAAVLSRLPQALTARIETSDDRIAESRPSLMLLQPGPGRGSIPNVLADWSAGRSTTPPPAAPAAPVARQRRPIGGQGPELELGELPSPVPVASAWSAPANSSASTMADAQTDERRRQPPVPPTTTEALGAYAAGTIAGIALGTAAAFLVL